MANIIAAIANTQYREQIREWISSPSNPIVMFMIIVSGHISGLFAYGATFWVDIRAYVFYSQIFHSVESARAVFDNSQYSFYSHIGWGEPFIWFILSKLPVNLTWPVMAIGKHLFGIIGLSYLFYVINKIFPSRIHIFTAVLISFLPFYQAMHNLLLTEAISADCILITLASSIVIHSINNNKYAKAFIINPVNLFGLAEYWYWMILTVSSCIAVQFRSILIIFPFSFIAIIFLSRPSLRCFVKCLLVAFLIFVSTLSYSIYRYRVIGAFHLPTAWGWNIITGQNITRSTSSKVLSYAKSVPWPDSKLYLSKIENGKFEREDLEKLLVFWRGTGLNNDEVRQICETILMLHYQDGGVPLKIRRFLVGLTTLGFSAYAPFLPDNLVPQRGKDGVAFYEDKIKQYRYFSWIEPKSDEYKVYSTVYFDSLPLHDHYLATIKPYLKLSKNVLSNPLHLGSIPIDIWFLCGCISIIRLYRNNKALMGFLLLPMTLYCIAIYLNPVSAGIRYSYTFVPAYICYLSIATSLMFKSDQG